MHLRRGQRPKQRPAGPHRRAIGRSATPGDASGCHLHFELWTEARLVRRRPCDADGHQAPEGSGTAGAELPRIDSRRANPAARSPASSAAPATTRASTSRPRDPAGGRGVWIRHTVHKRPGEEPTAAIWFTLFDAGRARAAGDEGELRCRLSSRPPPGTYIRIDGAVLEPGRAAGRIETPELTASWDLTFDDPGEPFHHLPYERLYDAPLPRTKFLSPYPQRALRRHG